MRTCWWRPTLSGDRKIVLHVGLPKTGTTTIQNVLYENRDFLLAEEGALYPFATSSPNNRLGTVFRDDPRKQTINKTAGLAAEELAARQKSSLDSLDARISSREWETLLLSGEVVYNLSEPEIAKLREWGEQYASQWTVLVCVRHPVDWTRSVVQQLLKRGGTLEGLYERPRVPMFRRRINRVISVFGRENVRVFDFDAAVKSEGGIVGEFARRAEINPWEYLASRATRTNESLSLEAVRILDALNRQRPMFVDGVKSSLRTEHELAYIRRIRGQKFDLPSAVKEYVRARSREDVAWLNGAFGLDLYRDIADPAPQAGVREEPAQALSDPAVDGIAEVFGELMTAAASRRILDRGREALDRGKLKRAEKMFQKAARLDPDAPQPKKLLAEVTAKQPGRATDAQQGGSSHTSEGQKSSKKRWPPQRGRDVLLQLKRKARRIVWTK